MKRSIKAVSFSLVLASFLLSSCFNKGFNNLTYEEFTEVIEERCSNQIIPKKVTSNLNSAGELSFNNNGSSKVYIDVDLHMEQILSLEDDVSFYNKTTLDDGENVYEMESELKTTDGRTYFTSTNTYNNKTYKEDLTYSINEFKSFCEEFINFFDFKTIEKEYLVELYEMNKDNLFFSLNGKTGDLVISVDGEGAFKLPSFDFDIDDYTEFIPSSWFETNGYFEIAVNENGFISSVYFEIKSDLSLDLPELDDFSDVYFDGSVYFENNYL